MTIPNKMYKCSNMFVTDNVFEYVYPNPDATRERQVADKGGDLYKNFLRYTTCLAHMKAKSSSFKLKDELDELEGEKGFEEQEENNDDDSKIAKKEEA